jgi:hypothetical protein
VWAMAQGLAMLDNPLLLNQAAPSHTSSKAVVCSRASCPWSPHQRIHVKCAATARTHKLHRYPPVQDCTPKGHCGSRPIALGDGLRKGLVAKAGAQEVDADADRREGCVVGSCRVVTQVQGVKYPSQLASTTSTLACRACLALAGQRTDVPGLPTSTAQVSALSLSAALLLPVKQVWAPGLCLP